MFLLKNKYLKPTNTHSEKMKEWDQNTFTALLAENILIKTQREEEREIDRDKRTDRQRGGKIHRDLCT